VEQRDAAGEIVKAENGKSVMVKSCIVLADLPPPPPPPPTPKSRLQALLMGAAKLAFDKLKGYLKDAVEGLVGKDIKEWVTDLPGKIKGFFVTTLTGIAKKISDSNKGTSGWLTKIDSTIKWLLGLLETTYSFTADVKKTIDREVGKLLAMAADAVYKTEGFSMFKSFLVEVNKTSTSRARWSTPPTTPRPCSR